MDSALASDPRLIFTGPSEAGSHRLTTAAMCLRRFRFGQEARANGTEPPPGESLVKGTLLHVALAHHYGKAVPSDRPPGLYEPMEAVEVVAEAHDWMAHVPTIGAAYEAYVARYGTDPEWRVLAVEHEIRVKIKPVNGAEPILYTARVDLSVEQDGKVYYVDHKTAYRLGTTTFTQYVLDTQMIGYQALGQRFHGDRFGGVILNRVKLSPPDFDRQMLDPAPAAVKQFRAHVVYWNMLIDTWKNVEPGVVPGAHADQVCVSKYGKCPYFDKCQWG